LLGSDCGSADHVFIYPDDVRFLAPNYAVSDRVVTLGSS
jgi:hypothetical protein